MGTRAPGSGFMIRLHVGIRKERVSAMQSGLAETCARIHTLNGLRTLASGGRAVGDRAGHRLSEGPLQQELATVLFGAEP